MVNSDIEKSQHGTAAATVVYSLTVFLGAFLLFQVQPMMGKFILPLFGGSPEVWTSCMLFFQVLLLGGYAYAHFSVSRFSKGKQAVVHVVLIAAAVAALVLLPKPGIKPLTPGHPVAQILLLLTVCVGLPYFVLSSTGPLIQGWFRETNPGKEPWRLYSLSNAGSLIALVSYPFLVEPNLTRLEQRLFWSVGLVVYAVFCSACAVKLFRSTSIAAVREKDGSEDIGVAAGQRVLWFGLAAGASIVLLAVTNKICQDLTVIPFLWVLPLCLYLLSFVICFHHERLYVRPVFLLLFILGIVGIIFARHYEEGLRITTLVWLYSAMLLVCCIVCHGELYRIRPNAKHLTGYYLSIAGGGALGGFFVAVIAPLIFDNYVELHLGLLFCVMFVLLADKNFSRTAGARRWVWIGLIMIVGIIGSFSQGKRSKENQRSIYNTRNFFGVLTIWKQDWQEPESSRLLMQHGTTFHGLQFKDPEKRLKPTAYYSQHSGVGVAMNNLFVKENRRIGAVGLGVGTIATYGREGDYFRFYEINPEVERLAREYFTYLESSKADIDVIIGDARLSLDNEAPQEFDLLVLDAFSSDAVPVHLLTIEAFDIYLKHIKPEGVIAIHLSSLHLDLEQVVWKIADRLGLENVWITSEERPGDGILAADWILLSKDKKFLEQNAIQVKKTTPYSKIEDYDLWTDDHINLFEILK